MQKVKLLELLTTVKPGLSSKEIIEFSTSFIFHDGRLMTYNDEVCVSVPLPKEIKDLEGAVDAKSLFQLVQKMDQDEVKIKQTAKELQLTGTGFKSGIRCKSMEDIPSIALPKNYAKVSPKLGEALRTCLFSTSSDATRPLLTCLHITPDRVESCDNFRGVAGVPPQRPAAGQPL